MTNFQGKSAANKMKHLKMSFNIREMEINDLNERSPNITAHCIKNTKSNARTDAQKWAHS